MEELFLSVLNLSITGSYVILVVLLFRFLLRKAPKKYMYVLWATVGFRLCCGATFSSVFSIFNLGLFDMDKALNQSGALTFIPKDIGYALEPEITTGISYVNSIVSGFLPGGTPQNSANPMQIWIFVGTVFWCAGVVTMIISGGIRSLRLKRKLMSAIQMEGNIWQSDAVASPFIFGVIRPKIYIPFGLDETVLHYVLAHERQHFRRGDYIIKCFAFLLLTVHWFNPLCWLAFRLLTRDMEMACDEAVMNQSGSVKKDYSTALLSANGGGRIWSANPVFFGESDMERRIRNILNWRKPGRLVSIVAAVTCVTVCIGCAANPGTPASQINDPEMDRDYIVDSVPYLSTLSSYIPALDSTLRYRFTSEGLYEETVFENTTHTRMITLADCEEINWGEDWLRVPFTKEQWEEMFEFDFLIPSVAEKLDRDWEYRAIDSRNFLLRSPEDLYLVTVYSGPDEKTYIWSICHLILEQ